MFELVKRQFSETLPYRRRSGGGLVLTFGFLLPAALRRGRGWLHLRGRVFHHSAGIPGSA